MKRILAYVVDIFIITILTSIISIFPFVNTDEYNEKYDEYTKEIEVYNNFLTDFDRAYNNKEISSKEYDNLLKDYEIFSNKLTTIYKDKKVTKEEYEATYNLVYLEYEEKVETYNYNLTELSFNKNVVTVICYILYFVVFQYFYNGQTLGKKLYKLQVKNKDNEKANILNLFIRTIIVTGVLFDIINLIVLKTATPSIYSSTVSILSLIENIITYIIIFMVLTRPDQRGLHDILGNTIVVSKTSDDNISSKRKSKIDKKNFVREAEYTEED